MTTAAFGFDHQLLVTLRKMSALCMRDEPLDFEMRVAKKQVRLTLRSYRGHVAVASIPAVGEVVPGSFLASAGWLLHILDWCRGDGRISCDSGFVSLSSGKLSATRRAYTKYEKPPPALLNTDNADTWSALPRMASFVAENVPGDPHDASGASRDPVMLEVESGPSGRTLRMVATDGHRLAVVEHLLEGARAAEDVSAMLFPTLVDCVAGWDDLRYGPLGVVGTKDHLAIVEVGLPHDWEAPRVQTIVHRDGVSGSRQSRWREVVRHKHAATIQVSPGDLLRALHAFTWHATHWVAISTDESGQVSLGWIDYDGASVGLGGCTLRWATTGRRLNVRVDPRYLHKAVESMFHIGAADRRDAMLELGFGASDMDPIQVRPVAPITPQTGGSITPTVVIMPRRHDRRRLQRPGAAGRGAHGLRASAIAAASWMALRRSGRRGDVLPPRRVGRAGVDVVARLRGPLPLVGPRAAHADRRARSRARSRLRLWPGRGPRHRPRRRPPHRGVGHQVGVVVDSRRCSVSKSRSESVIGMTYLEHGQAQAWEVTEEIGGVCVLYRGRERLIIDERDIAAKLLAGEWTQCDAKAVP